MIEIFHTLLHRRHFWRTVSYSELSELYVSLMLRTMALSMIGIFVPVYLYELGFSVARIALYFALVFGMRFVIDPFIGLFIRHAGVKHTIRASYMFLVLNLATLVALEYANVPLIIVALTQTLALAAFFPSFHLEYSMIKSSKHEGSELSSMVIFQKVAGAMGPLIGGLIATYISVQVTIFLAMIMAAFAAAPLMMTADSLPVKKLRPQSFDDYVKYRRYFRVFLGYGLYRSTSLIVWPLFIAVVALDGNAYASIGLISTVSLIVSILSASFFGQIVDARKGRALYRWSSSISALTLFARPLANTFGLALGFNVIAEPLSNGMGMPFSKGYYDSADSKGEDRLNFILVMSSYMHVARVSVFLLIWLVASNGYMTMSLQLPLVLGGIGALLMMTEKFRGLDG